MNENKISIEENTVEASSQKYSFPELLTVEPAPHVKGKMTTRSLMLRVIVALLPALAWGVYVFGYRAILLPVISAAACVLFEWASCALILRKKSTVSDLSAVVTGILIAMNVPSTFPIWMLIAGDLFAIVIVKQLFGGIGKNIVNPALAARVFLFAWPEEMTSFPSLDAVASATPLVTLKDKAVEGLSLSDMFFGNVSGCLGEVSALLILVGGVYLLVSKVITWHIPVSYIGTVALLCFCFAGDAPNLTFMLMELCAGGLALGAFFMATDYVTSPVTPLGRVIYGVICGLLTVFFRFFGANPEGVSYAILIANLLVWYIDKYTRPRRFGGNVK